MSRKSKYILTLEPVFIGISRMKPPKGCRYDIIGDKKKGTASLILNKLGYPEKEKTIIPTLEINDFVQKFCELYSKKKSRSHYKESVP